MAQTQPNILVVEDDRETRALIAKYLRTNSCNVTTASDGRDAVSGNGPRNVAVTVVVGALTLAVVYSAGSGPGSCIGAPPMLRSPGPWPETWWWQREHSSDAIAGMIRCY